MLKNRIMYVSHGNERCSHSVAGAARSRPDRTAGSLRVLPNVFAAGPTSRKRVDAPRGIRVSRQRRIPMLMLPRSAVVSKWQRDGNQLAKRQPLLGVPTTIRRTEQQPRDRACKHQELLPAQAVALNCCGT